MKDQAVFTMAKPAPTKSFQFPQNMSILRKKSIVYQQFSPLKSSIYSKSNPIGRLKNVAFTQKIVIKNNEGGNSCGGLNKMTKFKTLNSDANLNKDLEDILMKRKNITLPQCIQVDVENADSEISYKQTNEQLPQLLSTRNTVIEKGDAIDTSTTINRSKNQVINSKEYIGKNNTLRWDSAISRKSNQIINTQQSREVTSLPMVLSPIISEKSIINKCLSIENNQPVKVLVSKYTITGTDMTDDLMNSFRSSFMGTTDDFKIKPLISARRLQFLNTKDFMILDSNTERGENHQKQRPFLDIEKAYMVTQKRGHQYWMENRAGNERFVKPNLYLKWQEKQQLKRNASHSLTNEDKVKLITLSSSFEYKTDRKLSEISRKLVNKEAQRGTKHEQISEIKASTVSHKIVTRSSSQSKWAKKYQIKSNKYSTHKATDYNRSLFLTPIIQNKKFVSNGIIKKNDLIFTVKNMNKNYEQKKLQKQKIIQDISSRNQLSEDQQASIQQDNELSVTQQIDDKQQKLQTAEILIKPKKFIMQIAYPDVRNALLKRGWLENMNKNSLDFDLKFALLSTEIQFHELKQNQIINHSRGEYYITCKSGLITSLQDCPNLWISQAMNESKSKIQQLNKGVDSFFPTSFIMNSSSDFQDFQIQFNLVAAQSYVKQFIQNYEQKQEHENVQVCKEKLIVCLAIIQRQCADIDQLLEKKKAIYTGINVSSEEMNLIFKTEIPKSFAQFIKKEEWYCKLSRQFPELKSSSKNKGIKKQQIQANMHEICTKYIKQLRENYPQTRINGTQNFWIVKPSGLSRGRNIQIFNTLTDILKYTQITSSLQSNQSIIERGQSQSNPAPVTNKSWVVQKYIENPLLIENRKFDIRAWVLVACWNPLKIYLYNEPYIRFSASDYNPSNIKDLFSHLTNNSIGKNYQGSQKQRDKFPENMWSLDQFKEFLNTRNQRMNGDGSNSQRHDVWSKQFDPQLKDIIKISLLCSWDKIENRQNSIGIYGFDVIIDSDMKMWLLEINKCPTMEHSTAVTSSLVPKMLNDLVKVVIDLKEDPTAETGNYSLIYESPYIKDIKLHTNKFSDIVIEGKSIFSK